MNTYKLACYILATTFIFGGYTDLSASNMSNDIILEDSNVSSNDNPKEKKHLFNKVKNKFKRIVHKNQVSDGLQIEDRSIREAYNYLGKAKINIKLGRIKSNDWEGIRSNLLAARSKLRLTNDGTIVSYNILAIIDKQINGMKLTKEEKHIVKKYSDDWNKIFKKRKSNKLDLAQELESFIKKYVNNASQPLENPNKEPDLNNTNDDSNQHLQKVDQIPLQPFSSQEIKKSTNNPSKSFLDDINARRDKGTAGLKHVNMQ